MARTIIPETNLVREVAAAAPTFTAGDNTNGMYLADVEKAGTLILYVKNTNGAIRNVTLKASDVAMDYGPSWRKGLGDLAFAVAATTGETVIWINDTARFKNTDGTINVDISGAGTTIAALRQKDLGTLSTNIIEA